MANKLDNNMLNKIRSEIISQKKEAEIERYIYEILEDIDPSLVEIE